MMQELLGNITHTLSYVGNSRISNIKYNKERLLIDNGYNITYQHLMSMLHQLKQYFSKVKDNIWFANFMRISLQDPIPACDKGILAPNISFTKEFRQEKQK